MARPAQSRRECAARQAEVGAAVQLPLMSLSSERVLLVTGYVADVAADGSCSIIFTGHGAPFLIRARALFVRPADQAATHTSMLPLGFGSSSRPTGSALCDGACASLARRSQWAWTSFQMQLDDSWKQLHVTFESDECCMCLQPLAPNDAPAANLFPCNHMCMHWSCFEHFRSSSGAPFQCPICRETAMWALNTGGSP